MLGTAVATPPSFANGFTLGAFEIDGNQADNGDGGADTLDWISLPVATDIKDGSGSSDDIFGQGSKELEPAGWQCVTSKAAGKIDIVNGGQVAFRNVGGDQFLYASFFRKEVNGDAHMDFEFNKSTESVSSRCNGVPKRTQDDRLVAFDTENGGATIKVRAFRWDGNATTGSFTEIPTGTFADGAVNIPPSRTISGHRNGDFGEAVINLSKTIGAISCLDAAGVWLKTRSSTSITSELKDYTKQVPIRRGDCPVGTFTKQVRNQTAGQQFTATGPTTTTASPGNTLEYKLTYTNSGGGTSTGVGFADTLAAKQTLASCPECTSTAGGSLAWGPFSVAPGASRSVTFTVTLSGPFTAGTTPVKNSAVVTNDQENPRTSNEVTTNVTASANSGVAKAVRNVTANQQFTATGPTATDAKPGDVIEYRLTYTNTGDASATTVVVKDPIPAKTTFQSCNPTTCVVQNGEVRWNLGTQAPGATVVLTFTVQLDSTGWAQGQAVPVTNIAQVCADVEGCESSPPTTVTLKTPNLLLAKAVRNVTNQQAFTATGPTSTTAKPGDTLEYRLTLTNPGTAPSTNVVVTDLIQANQTYAGCTGGCTRDGSTLTWPATSVAPNGSVVYTFQVTLAATFPNGTTQVKNTATATSDQQPPKPSNETTTSVPAAPLVSQGKQVRNVTTNTDFAGSTDASLGDTVEYKLTVSNTGNANATNVVVSDPVPSGTTFAGCSDDCQRNGTVSWSIPTLAPSTSKVFTFQVTVNTTGYAAGTTTPVKNVAKACYAESTTCASSPEVTVNVKTPSSSLAKTVRNVTTSGSFATAATGAPGDTVEYQLVYTNGGPGIAHGVVVTDPVPNRTTYDSCTGGTSCGAAGSQVTWSLGDVAPGSVTLTFRVVLSSSFPRGTTTIPNVGSVASREEPAGTPSNQATVTVTAAPALGLLKASDPVERSTVVLGDLITYTLTYSNTGNAPAEGTVITETVPGGTTFQGCTPGCDVNGTTITWNVGTLPPSTSGSVTMTVSVNATVTCQICNVATITSTAEGLPPISVSSNQVCLVAQPAPNAGGANAVGSAMGASVKASLPLLPAIDEQRAETSSEQHGVGSDLGNPNAVLLDLTPLPVPNPLSIPPLLNATLMQSTSSSSVTTNPVKAHNLSTAETLDVDVLDGLVTADVVLASAEAQADGGSSSYSSALSTFKNLVVNGVARSDVAPNTRIDLGNIPGIGLGVVVTLREEVGATSGPAANQLFDGTYDARLLVNMIHVTVRDGNALIGGNQPIDVIVSQAVAHADFPQTRVCNARPTRTVSGSATIASVSVFDLPPAEASVGYVVIPASGGTRGFIVDSASVPDGDPVVTAQTVESFSTGTLGGTSTDAHSFASAEDVCIRLEGPDGGCTISATAVRSVASSFADAGARGSDDAYGSDTTRLVDVQVAGLPLDLLFPLGVPANTTIPVPGIGYVTLNEQFCDGVDIDESATCDGGNTTGHTGLTVRAIHVFVSVDIPVLELTAGTEIIVAEAHSDATWK